MDREIDNRFDKIDETLRSVLDWAARHDGQNEGLKRILDSHDRTLYGNGGHGLNYRVQHMEEVCKSQHETLEAEKIEAAAAIRREASAIADALARTATPLWKQILIPTMSTVLAAAVLTILTYAAYVFLLHGWAK